MPKKAGNRPNRVIPSAKQGVKTGSRFWTPHFARPPKNACFALEPSWEQGPKRVQKGVKNGHFGLFWAILDRFGPNPLLERAFD